MPDFEPVAALPPGVAPLLAAARGVFGEAHVRCGGFAVFGEETPDWLLRHTLEGTRFDLGPLLLSKAFRRRMPQLAECVDPDRVANFEQISPLALAASIADALAGGGASLQRTPVSEAHDLALGFVGGLVGAGLDQVIVLHSRAAWSSWFACDVWDRTWIVADGSTDLVWLLCLTDCSHPRRH